MIILILYGWVFVSSADMISRLSDPHSEERLKAEISRAATWIDDLIYRATVSERNFEINASRKTPSGRFEVSWHSVDDREEWSSKSIGLQVYSEGKPIPPIYRYNWRSQTLTPALTFRVFKQKGRLFTETKWLIIISAYGLVHVEKKT